MRAAPEQAVYQVAALSCNAGGAAHAAQELTDFRLEDDDECDCPDVDDGVEQGGEQLHVQCHRHDADDEEHEYRYEDVYGRRSP